MACGGTAIVYTPLSTIYSKAEKIPRRREETSLLDPPAPSILSCLCTRCTRQVSSHGVSSIPNYRITLQRYYRRSIVSSKIYHGEKMVRKGFVTFLIHRLYFSPFERLFPTRIYIYTDRAKYLPQMVARIKEGKFTL